jgi:acetyl-CoA synthetase (ADP-forming)
LEIETGMIPEKDDQADEEVPMTQVDDSFRYLFYPRSVAVIGASGNPLKMGHQCMLSLKESGFPGPVFPIHPHEKQILGIQVYPSLDQVPGEVDLAILVVPANEAIPALQSCRQKGVRGAVVITAGFREIENPRGEELQREMATVANQGRIKIIGPNTFGMVNVHARLNASFTPIFSRLRPGPVTVVSQSGGISHLVAYQALDEGVGLGKVVGLGNRCNVDFADLLPFLAEDPETQCIILFIEGLDNPRALFSAVRKVVSRKPVVAMKAGKYAASLQAARSHTGSLAGRSEIYEASLRQAGAVVVQEPGELLDVAKIMTILQPFSGRNVAVMSFQAGPGILLTDAVMRNGLSMATFSGETQRELNHLLPPLTIRNNPVDMAFARNEEAFEKTAQAILTDANVDALVIFLLHHPFMTPRRIKAPLLRQKQQSGKPILLCVNSPRGLIEEEIQELEANGIPVYSLPDRTIRALKGLIQYGEIKKRGEV